MTAYARSRIMGHEAKWLRCSGLDGLDEIDSKLLVQDGEFVDERYVHVAKDVLKHLRSFGYRWAADLEDWGLQDSPVKASSQHCRLIVHPTNDLRNFGYVIFWIAIINSLWRVYQAESSTCPAFASLEDWEDDLLRGARIACAFEYDEFVIGK